MFCDDFDTIENEELKLEILEKFLGDEVMLPFYYYKIIRKSDGLDVGKISIRIGDNFHSYYNGHIGYEIYEDFRGRGIAYKASLMVLEVARFHGMKKLFLTCNEDNISSYKTIEKLGGELIEICEVPKEYFGWHKGMKKQRIYMLKI